MIARASAVFAILACVAGCAGPAASLLTGISAQGARDAVTIGKSTRADVIAALGKTAAISFDSGFEVWVYQVARETPVMPGWGKTGTTEFVLLFAPSGIVAKARIRPAPPPAAAKGA